MARRELQGVSVVVAGAGLAGLTAARALERRGAAVTIVEARDRVGGRVWTLRDGFAGRQHAEAGADLIEGGQEHVRALARDLGLTTVRILRRGFGFYGPNAKGRREIDSGGRAFEHVARSLRPQVDALNTALKRWDSAVGQRLARTSVAEWLDRVKAPAYLRARVRGFRGFFLADPEDLSLLPLVEQFAEWGTPGQDRIYRIAEGNDRLATVLARTLRARILLGTIARRIRQAGNGIVVSIENASGALSEIRADYLVSALPASTLRDVIIEPSLPGPHREAIAHLRYGRATRLILQFDTRFWKKPGKADAFGTDAGTGAVWDGNEHQRGPGILIFLAGGRASGELQELLRNGGEAAVLREIAWLGTPSRLLAARRVTWEDDPWVRGGYAYFDPGFDPLWRDWLARPAGRIVFAGEHTSVKWQGYMNGAIESGLRAAAEIAAMHDWRFETSD